MNPEQQFLQQVEIPDLRLEHPGKMLFLSDLLKMWEDAAFKPADNTKMVCDICHKSCQQARREVVGDHWGLVCPQCGSKFY